jgi:hypothetical protein
MQQASTACPTDLSACVNDASQTTGSSSSGVGGGGVTLQPNSTGYVQDAALGVVGYWYAYGDSISPVGVPGGGSCEVMGMHSDALGECSVIDSPPLPAGVAGFPPDANGAMCLKGTAAMVINDAQGMPDYANIYGIGLGLDFNYDGTTKGAWNATAHGVTGFSFDISGVPSGGIDIEFPTTNTHDGLAAPYGVQPTADGHVIVHWTDVVPTYTFNGTEPVFDPIQLESIQVHVPTNTIAAIPVPLLCISNLTALTD